MAAISPQVLAVSAALSGLSEINGHRSRRAFDGSNKPRRLKGVPATSEIRGPAIGVFVYKPTFHLERKGDSANTIKDKRSNPDPIIR